MKITIHNSIMTTESTKKEPQNCWEFMNCPKEQRERCIVYELDSGNECWFMSNVKNGCHRVKKGESCFNCPWFKKNNPNI